MYKHIEHYRVFNCINTCSTITTSGLHLGEGPGQVCLPKLFLGACHYGGLVRMCRAAFRTHRQGGQMASLKFEGGGGQMILNAALHMRLIYSILGQINKNDCFSGPSEWVKT